jgi:glycosyltransferase involved in cell wall biosynthesis
MENIPPNPFVSIIVPVYNGGQAVIQCTESLLAQNYPRDRFEIIFVDNKSKDSTAAMLQPYAEAGKILLKF